MTTRNDVTDSSSCDEPIWTGTPAPKIFSIQVLMDYVGTATDTQFAELVGVDRRTVQRWKRTGIDCWKADTLCVNVAGVHPANVYGRLWADSERFATGA
jgi:hypothetical protein